MAPDLGPRSVRDCTQVSAANSPPVRPRLRVLLLSHVRPGHAATTHDHEHALAEFSHHDVYVHSPVEQRAWVPPLSEFDVIILHYSLMIWSENYLPSAYHEPLSAFRGLKVQFIQDEYREVHAAMDMMERLGVDLLFTCVPSTAINSVYGELVRRGVRVEQTLTGYVPISFDTQFVRPMAERPLDVVYRAREVPFALGKLAHEKFLIAQQFLTLGNATDLRLDISSSESARIYGTDWTKFLASSRTSLGTESGASITDFTGEIDRTVKAYVAANPDADFAEVHANLLEPFEGNVVINAISPRAFEAIFLRNVLILFPGEYSNILKEGRHFVRLEKNLSNFKEVTEQIRDAKHLTDIAERAFTEIVASGAWSYSTFAAHVDALIEDEWARRVYRHPISKPLPASTVPDETFAAGYPSRIVSTSRAEWRERLRSLGARSEALQSSEVAQYTGEQTQPGDPSHQTIQAELSPATAPHSKPAYGLRRRFFRLLRGGKRATESVIGRLLGRRFHITVEIGPRNLS